MQKTWAQYSDFLWRSGKKKKLSAQIRKSGGGKKQGEREENKKGTDFGWIIRVLESQSWR